MNILGFAGFNWDEGNARKNEKHGVSQGEIEQVFRNIPILLAPDPAHSLAEDRFAAWGVTDEGRHLAVVFTFRDGQALIRPISARPMNRKERKLYEKAT